MLYQASTSKVESLSLLHCYYTDADIDFQLHIAYIFNITLLLQQYWNLQPTSQDIIVDYTVATTKQDIDNCQPYYDTYAKKTLYITTNLIY